MPVLGRADVIDLSSQLRAAAGQLIRRLRNETGTSLSWSQSALSRQPSATASQLAVDNGLRTQTVWATIDTLVARGLAVRARDPEDRRNVQVTLTQAGLDELIHDRRVRERWIVDVLTHEFTADERSTLAAAIPLIERLARSGRTTNNTGRRTDARL